jgi:hypothetical protein
MKLFLATVAVATIAATSSFAAITPEDRIVLEEQRANGIDAMGEEVTITPVFNLTGPSSITEGDTVTLTLIGTDTYEENNDIGRR